jgi:hypothetical protein
MWAVVLREVVVGRRYLIVTRAPVRLHVHRVKTRAAAFKATPVTM